MRLTAVLSEPVTINCLFKAVERAEKRFPYFIVRLRRGFFWYYLEQVKDPIMIRPDDQMPCRAFGINKENRLLIRILVHKNRLSVELSHILTDGHGIMTFLKSILLYYFREKGIVQNNQIDDFFIRDADEEEFTDAYSRYFKENIPTVLSQPKAFHLPYHLRKKPRFDVLYALIALQELKQKAKEKGVSITEYLIAVYLWILQEIFYECKK